MLDRALEAHPAAKNELGASKSSNIISVREYVNNNIFHKN